MSFIRIPSRICIPTVPGLDYMDDDVYRGYGADGGTFHEKFAFRTDLGYIISEKLAYSLKVGNEEYEPVFADVNGYIYWSNGNDYIYNSLKYGWVKCDDFPGFEPEEDYDADEKEYIGDSFWSGDLPAVSGTSSFSPRGSNRNKGSKVTVSCYWQRWQSEKQFGEYSPKNGASGKLYFGSPRWKDNDGVYYVRSANRENGVWTYGNIYRQDSKWIIGNIDDPAGWWEGSEPSKSGSRTFKFTVPAGSEIKGKNKVVTFQDYVLGEDTTEVYLTEVAVWR